MLLSELKKDLPNIHIERDGEFRLTGKLGASAMKGVLSFVRDKRYIGLITDEISCIVTTEETLPYLPENLGVVIANNPRGVFGLIHNLTSEKQILAFNPCLPVPTTIGKNCKIHKSAVIAEQNVIIGDNTNIGANVVIHEFVTIGSGCDLLTGAVIGDDGFEYCRLHNDMLFFKHMGKVKIGDNVHIHTNTCVARALFVDDCTIIRNNVTIDCLAYVGHAAKIGNGAIVTAGSSLAGSVNIGDNAYIGMNSSVKQLLNVGNGSLIGMGSVVVRDVGTKQVVVGNPAGEIGWLCRCGFIIKPGCACSRCGFIFDEGEYFWDK